MVTVLTRFLSAGLPAVLAGTLGLQLAHADIYTWVDASGTVNLSNLQPPEGVRVTNVTHETPQKLATRDNAALEAIRQAELQALTDRVRQLETEVEVARRPAPPPQVVYVPIPSTAPMQYQAEMPPPASSGCNPGWTSCWGWWGSGFYPASVVVVRAPSFHRFPHVHTGHRFPLPRPARGSPGFRGH
jgi:hypothetical protein